MPVKGVQEIPYSGPVYNLNVEGTGTYLVQGVAVHNSPRDKDFRWRVYEAREAPTGDSGLRALQDTELSGWSLFESDFGPSCQHVRVHPLLHWTEEEVWMYIKDRGLPVNPLYFARNGKRFRSLGCEPCTLPLESKATTLDEIIEEVRRKRGMERAGRAQDKEEAYVMERLRALGYM
ncbi:TPA: hypothetical protein EYP44_05320 [Candidatus Bathyarchaeota archaeon]|nr:hypothetical protein [Candidatus Bathyarchaeota archaeon]